jgi:hypothetical protein
MRSVLLRGALAAVAILLAALPGTAYLWPPASAPTDASAQLFSAERAMRHVEVLASSPRPVGSVGHEVGRAYILAELRRLGLEPEVQETVSAFRFPGADGFSAAQVRNVVARIEGTRSGPAILLNAHYDGANTGVAAGDCGACVAALLETARALTDGERPGRDVILVFSDAEEMGDHGAHAFATQHPWMRDVGLALNYEAMGTSGPGTLYVTGPHNVALVDALKGAMPRGFGNSFVTAIFSATPEMRNACDLQDYLEAGKPGLGFILHGDTQQYHTLLDTPANLDHRSLQSFGDSALGMVRAFSMRDLRAEGDAVFFPLAPVGTVAYAEGWAVPLAALALVLAVALGARAARQGARSLHMAAAAVALPVTAGLSAVAAMAIWAAMRAIDPVLQVFLIGTYATGWYVAGLTLLAAAVAVALAGWMAGKMSAREAATGVTMGLAAIGVGLALTFPGTAYVATLPALAAVSALALFNRSSAGPAALLLLPVIAITALVASLVAPGGIIVGFMARLEAFSGLPLLALPTAITALAVVFSLPFLRRFVAARRPATRPLAGALLALSAVALIGGTFQSRFSEAQPRPEAVRYELDSTRGTARWTTNDPRPGAWSGQFFPPGSRRLESGSVLPGGPPTFAAAAPVLPMPSPSVLIATDQVAEGQRQLRVQIASPRGAAIIEVRVTAQAPILAAAIGGQPLDLRDFAPAGKGRLIFYASGFDASGFALTLTLARSTPLLIEVADMSDGLPGLQRTRPPSTMPTPGATADGTVVRTRLVLAGSQEGTN